MNEFSRGIIISNILAESGIKELISLYQVSHSVRNLLNDQEIIFRIAKSFRLYAKIKTFQELIAEYNEQYTTDYCFLLTEKQCLIYAARSGNSDLVSKILTKLPENVKRYYATKAYVEAAKFDRLHIINFLLRNYDDDAVELIVKIFTTAVEHVSKNIVENIIKYYKANSYGFKFSNFYHQGLIAAVKSESPAMFSMIADNVDNETEQAIQYMKKQDLLEVAVELEDVGMCYHIINNYNAGREALVVFASAGWLDNVFEVVSAIKLYNSDFIRSVKAAILANYPNVVKFLVEEMKRLNHRASTLEIMDWVENASSLGNIELADYIEGNIKFILDKD